jgi:UDP-2,4-diacetamido-2,4,6-trideoxy-beta-L-altropyranose hydrolase
VLPRVQGALGKVRARSGCSATLVSRMGPSLSFRPASLGDAELLLAWRNDPLTCNNSLHTEAVRAADHVRWLIETLERSDRVLLIAEVDGAPVGTVRLDGIGSTDRELSWTVAPDARGRGIGTMLVLTATERFGPPLVARIKVGNAASARIAARAGFARAAQEGEVEWWRLSGE